MIGVADRVATYVREVRAELAELPAEDVDDLTKDGQPLEVTDSTFPQGNPDVWTPPVSIGPLASNPTSTQTPTVTTPMATLPASSGPRPSVTSSGK